VSYVITDTDRAWAETVLVDECSVLTDADAAPTWSDELGRNVYGGDVTFWSGKCSVNFGTSLASRPIAEGGDTVMLDQWVVRVPIDAEGIRSGMAVVVTAVHPGGDQDLLGRAFTVRRVGARSNAVLRRLYCDVRAQTSE
jgi:hypothetical protein